MVSFLDLLVVWRRGPEVLRKLSRRRAVFFLFVTQYWFFFFGVGFQKNILWPGAQWKVCPTCSRRSVWDTRAGSLVNVPGLLGGHCNAFLAGRPASQTRHRASVLEPFSQEGVGPLSSPLTQREFRGKRCFGGRGVFPFLVFMSGGLSTLAPALVGAFFLSQSVVPGWFTPGRCAVSQC